MSNYRSNSKGTVVGGGRGGGSGSKSNDEPPMSRLFVICNKTHTEEDFDEEFSRYGEVEDIWVVKDKYTNASKGIAYVKFSKTSDAAKAQEELNGKCIGDSDRPIKVLVAANRNEGSGKTDNEQEKYVRLFIVISKSTTEEHIRDEFEKYGEIENISIVKDRNSGQSKGFGYVKFHKFSDAAVAYESCPGKYKAVFAEPKSSNRNNSSSGMDNQYNNRYNDSFDNSRNGRGGGGGGSGGGSGFGNNFGSNFGNDIDTFNRPNSCKQPTCLEVICSSMVNQDQLWRLFDIIPGLDYCQLTREHGPRTYEATVVYNNPEAAIYAKEKLHGLEYPPGERIIVKMAGLDNMRMDNSFIERNVQKNSLCNIDLPPAQPLANSDAQVARRCFIVLASGLPHMILKNVFSCFGNLIDVYLLPNKNCGYVKYASEDSAQKAINKLNGAEVCGVRLKVMEADEPGEPGRKRMRRE